MGVTYKGNGGGGKRGRPYGLMLLVAFGAALLGVMVLHKLRERRIFNLLVIEKDRQLFSLQLLLQCGKDLPFAYTIHSSCEQFMSSA
ncbi:protein hook [Tripterygium wilfordii]|uniref:Protein hook n=1 Tax=Tripterygium wilfordii TaxID=458696 RepID=A0A7J7D549_TRIWF|nr:protein hook [Tripterygium wilfordii]